MELSFDVKNQIITRTDRNRVVANSTDYLSVEVTFSDDWDDCDKQLNFKNGDMEISYQLVDDAIPATAHLNLGVGTWKVYAIGTNGEQRILTNSVNLAVVASGYLGTDGPSPNVYDQLLVIIDSLHTEAASTAVVRSAVEAYFNAHIVDIINDYFSSQGSFDEVIRQAVAEYLSDSIDAATVNGHTVEDDVPADAKFTDTIYDDDPVWSEIADIHTEIGELRDLIVGGADYQLADDFRLNSGDSRSSTGTTPPTETLKKIRSISTGNLQNYNAITFDWSNSGSSNSYGYIRGYYKLDGIEVDVFNYDRNHSDVDVNPESGSVSIDISNLTGSHTLEFGVEARSKSSATTYISRSVMSVSDLMCKR